MVSQKDYQKEYGSATNAKRNLQKTLTSLQRLNKMTHYYALKIQAGDDSEFSLPIYDNTYYLKSETPIEIEGIFNGGLEMRKSLIEITEKELELNIAIIKSLKQ